MSAEYGPQKIGNVQTPLTASLTNSLLQDADPAVHYTIQYLTGVLQVHLGDRWDAAVVDAGLPDLATKIVATAVPYDPAPYLQQVQYTFPILAVFPVRETPSERTRHYFQSDAEWRVQWILPTLNAAQHLKLYPFLRVVGRTLLGRIEQGWDPDVMSAALFAQLSGLSEIKVTQIEYGGITSNRGGRVPTTQTDLFFPAVELTLSAIEQREGVAPEDLLEDMTAAIKVKDSDGEQTVVELSQDLT